MRVSEAPVGSAGRHDCFDGAEGMAATAKAAFQGLVASRLSASSHRGAKARQHLKLVEIGKMFRLQPAFRDGVPGRM